MNIKVAAFTDSEKSINTVTQVFNCSFCLFVESQIEMYKTVKFNYGAFLSLKIDYLIKQCRPIRRHFIWVFTLLKKYLFTGIQNERFKSSSPFFKGDSNLVST